MIAAPFSRKQHCNATEHGSRSLAVTAHRLCPRGVFLRPRMEYCAEVSDQIRAIFEKYTPLVEPR